jgi:predicted NBD/HSP70 family sugar kinase/predicted transcriptional regulator
MKSHLNTRSILFIDSSGTGNKARRQKQLSKIVKLLSKNTDAVTIPELAHELNISVPTATNYVEELLNSQWVYECGVKETGSGRKPVLYSLNKDKVYTVGLRVDLSKLQLVISRIDFLLVYEVFEDNFIVENTAPCLEHIVKFVETAIKNSGVDRSKIAGVGVGITGRVNSKTGESFSYFNFMEVPLKQYLSDVLKLEVLVGNDTRTAGIAELVHDKEKGKRNSLFVNVSQGLGLSMMFNGKIISGESGFAGEFGHMQFGKKNRLCVCGKRGCLGTEVSGYGLYKDLIEALETSEGSLFFESSKIDEYHYKDVFKAANQGDVLSITLLQHMGVLLGEALGNLINLLNPGAIIVGGEFVCVREIFIDAINIGLKKTALVNPLKQCLIVSSELGKDAFAKGAAAMVLKHHELV